MSAKDFFLSSTHYTNAFRHQWSPSRKWLMCKPPFDTPIASLQAIKTLFLQYKSNFQAVGIREARIGGFWPQGIEKLRRSGVAGTIEGTQRKKEPARYGFRLCHRCRTLLLYYYILLPLSLITIDEHEFPCVSIAVKYDEKCSRWQLWWKWLRTYYAAESSQVQDSKEMAQCVKTCGCGSNLRHISNSVPFWR